MKRKLYMVSVNTSPDKVRKILENAEEFILNWPYVVKIRKLKGIIAQIRLPRFIFSFEDEYTFSISRDKNAYIYEGKGKNSKIIVMILLESQKKATTHVTVDVRYSGKREFILGKTIEELAKGIAETLKVMAESFRDTSITIPKAIIDIDFDDPMSLAGFLSRAKMVYTGLHTIKKGQLFESLMKIISNYEGEIFYISGVSQDGIKSFKVLLDQGRITAIHYRDGKGSESVKVTGNNQDEAIKAFQIADKIEGVYMINIWVPIGGGWSD